MIIQFLSSNEFVSFRNDYARLVAVGPLGSRLSNVADHPFACPGASNKYKMALVFTLPFEGCNAQI